MGVFLFSGFWFWSEARRPNGLGAFWAFCLGYVFDLQGLATICVGRLSLATTVLTGPGPVLPPGCNFSASPLSPLSSLPLMLNTAIAASIVQEVAMLSKQEIGLIIGAIMTAVITILAIFGIEVPLPF